MSTGPEPAAHQWQPWSALAEKLVRASEFLVVIAAGLLVIVAVVIATGVLYALFINGLRTNLTSIGSIDALQPAVQNVFAGVLLLMLGLELLETLKTYFKDYHFRVEVILVVAIIGGQAYHPVRFRAHQQRHVTGHGRPDGCARSELFPGARAQFKCGSPKRQVSEFLEASRSLTPLASEN